jgi:cohesin complex subunit SA-1/2
MTFSDDAQASSPPATEEVTNRRKSGRAVRKPNVFAEEHHEGSLLSNGSGKRKRQPNGDVMPDSDPDHDEIEDEADESDEESEASAGEEELKERRRQSRSRKAQSKSTTKRAKISSGTGTTLAIRSANTPAKGASQKAKIQKARSRQSQANQEGLYGKPSDKQIRVPGLMCDYSRSVRPKSFW